VSRCHPCHGSPRAGRRPTGPGSSTCLAGNRSLRLSTSTCGFGPERPARILDVACGTGWSSIATAQAYPSINVDGFDLDHYTISAARGNAERASVADRLRFSVSDAADLGGARGYDLVRSSRPCMTCRDPATYSTQPGRCSPTTEPCSWPMGWSPTSSRSAPHHGNELSTAGASSLHARRYGRPAERGNRLYAVSDHLQEHHPDALEIARKAVRCFEPYGEDPQHYAWRTRISPGVCSLR
jgi:SAM-dependent methyltransferase